MHVCTYVYVCVYICMRVYYVCMHVYGGGELRHQPCTVFLSIYKLQSKLRVHVPNQGTLRGGGGGGGDKE